MGNSNSMSKLGDAELDNFAEGEMDRSKIRSAMRGIEATKTKRRKNNSQILNKDRNLEASDLDDIYDLVVSLNKQGKEGRELLDRFVEMQTNRDPSSKSRLVEKSKDAVPLESITIITDPRPGSEMKKMRATAA
jgi:hypothetical protein